MISSIHIEVDHLLRYVHSSLEFPWHGLRALHFPVIWGFPIELSWQLQRCEPASELYATVVPYTVLYIVPVHGVSINRCP